MYVWQKALNVFVKPFLSFSGLLPLTSLSHQNPPPVCKPFQATPFSTLPALKFFLKHPTEPLELEPCLYCWGPPRSPQPHKQIFAFKFMFLWFRLLMASLPFTFFHLLILPSLKIPPAWRHLSPFSTLSVLRSFLADHSSPCANGLHLLRPTGPNRHLRPPL